MLRAPSVIYLGELLSVLDRGEADEVVLQAGRAAFARRGKQENPLSDDDLTRDSILAALHGAALGSIVPPHDTAGEVQVVDVRGRQYLVSIARFLELLEVRIAAIPTLTNAGATTRRDLSPVADDGMSEAISIPPLPPAYETIEAPPRLERPAIALAPDRPRVSTPVPVLPRARVPTPIPPSDGGPQASATFAPVRPVATHHAVRNDPPRNATPVAAADHERGSQADAAFLELVASARAERASDVHLSSDEPPRIRVGAELVRRGHVLSGADVERMVASVLPLPAQVRLRERGHADLAFVDPRIGRLRLNVARHRGGVKLCARLVAEAPPTPEELHLPAELDRFTLHHQGLIVVAGPSGHGKTTTMAALVDRLNAERAIHIVTVEDPVEIIFPVRKAIVSQREVGTHTESWQRALRASLRQDPDVIVIGELRDRETVRMALTAAETGHLVLATINAPSGAKTIERLIDMFAPDDQPQVRATMAGTLKLVVTQRLVQRIDGQREAAFEIIAGGVPLWSLIRERKMHQMTSLLQRGKGLGMRRFEDSLRELLLAGVISEEEARRHAEDPRALAGADPTAGVSWNPLGAGGI